MDRRARNRFLGIHCLITGIVAAYPLYQKLMDGIPLFLRGCVLHDWLHVYCPMCGGTRAVKALLHLDFVQAVRCNALVVLLAVLALVWDVAAWIRLLKGHRELYALKPIIWWGVIALVVLFGIGRNWLLIRFGYDPLGDLILFWNGSNL